MVGKDGESLKTGHLGKMCSLEKWVGYSHNPNYRSLRLWRDILSLKDSVDNIRFFVRSGYKILFWPETHSLYSFNVDDIIIVCFKCLTLHEKNVELESRSLAGTPREVRLPIKRRATSNQHETVKSEKNKIKIY